MEYFIKMVRKYRCLWDNSNIHYRDHIKKQSAWDAIAKQCGFENDMEAKNQWKKLRDSHREALRRRRSGGTVSAKIGPWKYENVMEFILPVSGCRETTTNSLATDSSTNQEGDEEVGDSDDSALHVKMEPVDRNHFIIERERKKTLLSVIERDKRREIRHQEIDESRGISIESDSRDPLLHLFISLCEKTRQLPKHLQLRVEKEVFHSVTQAEEEALKLLNFSEEC